MRLTTTFTSIAACALFIAATLTSTTIATGQQQSGSNSLAYTAPESNGGMVRSHFTSRRFERRRRLMMVKRHQEEPEEEDEEEYDEDYSSGKTSSKHTGGDSKVIEDTTDPAIHTVAKTGDKVLGAAQSKDPLSPAGKVLGDGHPRGTSANGYGHGKEEDEGGEERRAGEA